MSDKERIERQLKALRSAARCKGHFAHDKLYRTAFVRGILELRKELQHG
jgi:hypothetical protein